MLAAAGHIAGAFFASFCLWLLTAAFLGWAGQQREKQKRREVAAAIGVAFADLNSAENESAVLRHLSERFSSDLLRNRLSDLFYFVHAGLAWFILGVQIIIAGWVVWGLFTEGAAAAPWVWFAVVVSAFGFVMNVASFAACYLLTGRTPGEARQTRAAIGRELDGSRLTP